MDNFVLAVVPKKTATKMQKELLDLVSHLCPKIHPFFLGNLCKNLNEFNKTANYFVNTTRCTYFACHVVAVVQLSHTSGARFNSWDCPVIFGYLSTPIAVIMDACN